MMLPIALYQQQSETFPVELILLSSSWISFLRYYSISRVTEPTCSGKCLWGFLVQPHMQSRSGSVFISCSFHGTAMPRGKTGWHGCPGSHFSAFSPECYTATSVPGCGEETEPRVLPLQSCSWPRNRRWEAGRDFTDRSEGLRERKDSSDWNTKDQRKSKQEEKNVSIFLSTDASVCLFFFFLTRAFHVCDPDLLCWPIYNWNMTPYLCTHWEQPVLSWSYLICK